MDKGEKKVISTKRKFINDGVFRAEVNELLQTSLAEFGFSGIEVNFRKGATDVRVLVNRYNELMNPDTKNGVKINELKGLIEQRFNLKKNDHKFTLSVKRAFHRGVNAQEQCEYLKKKLLLGTPARSAAMYVIKNMLSKGAKGCEVIISGKLRQQRAKSAKFKDGYMIHTGEPKLHYLDTAVRHIELRQGIMGIKVKIMLPYDPEAKTGRKIGVPEPLPDNIRFRDMDKRQEEEQ